MAAASRSSSSRPVEARLLGGEQLLVVERLAERRWCRPRPTTMTVSTVFSSSSTRASSGIERAVDDDDLVLGVVDDVGELLGEQPDVEGVQDRAHGRHGQVRLEVALVVPAERPHPVARTHPEPPERRRQLLGPAGHLGERRRPVAVGLDGDHLAVAVDRWPWRRMPLIRSGPSCIVLRMTASVLPATVLAHGSDRSRRRRRPGSSVLAVGLGGCVALVGGAGRRYPSTGSGAAAGRRDRSTTSGRPWPTSAGEAGETVTTGAAGPPRRRCRPSWEQLDQAAAATVPGSPLGGPGGHRAGRERQRAVDRPGRGQRGQPGRRRGADAVRAGHLRRLRRPSGPGGAAPAVALRPGRRGLHGRGACCAPTAPDASGLYGAVWDYNHDADLRRHGAGPGRGARERPRRSARRRRPHWRSPPPSWACRTSGAGRGRAATTAPGSSRRPTGRPGSRSPRVAQDQFDAGPTATPPVPGDLVFFGAVRDRRQPRRHLPGGRPR